MADSSKILPLVIILYLCSPAVLLTTFGRSWQVPVHPNNFKALRPQNVWIKPAKVVSRTGATAPYRFHEETPHYPWVIPENVYIKPGAVVAKNLTE